MSLREKLLNAKPSNTLFSDLPEINRRKNRIFAKISVLLRECRRKVGLDQTELAKLLNVSQPAVSKLESGETNCSIGKLVETFDALGYDIEINVKKQDDFRQSTKTEYSFVFIPALGISSEDNKRVDWKME